MSSKIKEDLAEHLGEYILHTLTYSETVKEFCDGESKWSLQRETELETMRDIKDRGDQITLTFDHVQKSEDKAKAFGEYTWNSLTQFTADSKRQELEKELGEVLKNILEGLEKVHVFLDAVEKLAVTSLFVFMGESFMPKGVSSMAVRSVISTSRIVSPLLVHFKRDAGAFFLPSLSNVDVMAFQLDKYIRITQQICGKMEKKSRSVSGSGGVYEWKTGESKLKFNLNLSEESLQKLYHHLLQLTKIRMDESFRLTYMFDTKAADFMFIFSTCHPRMLDFLSELEEAAVQLDKMRKGSNISTVAGSSVGIAGGVLSIVGLALAPVTAGASLALTLTGVGLGVTSGVNGIVTGITEAAVNNHHGKTANNIFTSFMEDVEKITDCIEEVTSRFGTVSVVEDGKQYAAGCNDVDDLVDGVLPAKPLGPGDVVGTAVNVGLQEAKAVRNIPQLVADLPDIGQMAKGAPLAISKSARAGLIGLNVLFIGLDVLFIAKDGMSLAKGSKNEVAQIIRSRSVLWRSEVEAWEKIHDHLCDAMPSFYKSQEVLEQQFLP